MLNRNTLNPLAPGDSRRWKLLLPALLVWILCLSAPAVHAQATGLSFLKVGTSAAGLGMADALTADAQGAFATYYNPAGLAVSAPNMLAASHTVWVGQTRTYNAAVRLGAGQKSGWGGAVTAVSSGDIEARTGPTADPEGVISAQFVNVSLSYGRKIGPVRAGVTGKYLSERISVATASGYAFDVGLQLPLLKNKLQVGAALQQIGRMEALDVEATPLPKTIRGGIALYPFRVVTQEDNMPFLTTAVTAEVSHQWIDNHTQFRTGVAAQLFEVIHLRTGYLSGDLLRNFSFGGGLSLESLRFDYSYLPFETGFGTAGHVITLAYLW